MTKEQAIELLKADIKHWENTSVSVDHLYMAIKALEQQPSEDCVSRAEMLKYQQYLRGKMPNEENHKLWEFIKDLPPVTPAQSTCKDCKHNKKDTKTTTMCDNGHRFFMREPSTFYCVDFEKRGSKNGSN